VAVLNGLINLIIKSGKIDKDFIEKHTIGFEVLKETAERYTPERVQEISGVPEKELKRPHRFYAM
jgi:anaerobic selenocysteine-containing dehydrogenase